MGPLGSQRTRIGDMWMPSTKNRRASVVTVRIPCWRDRVQVKLRDVYACNPCRVVSSTQNIYLVVSLLLSMLLLQHSILSIVTLFYSYLHSTGQFFSKIKRKDVPTNYTIDWCLPSRKTVPSTSFDLFAGASCIASSLRPSGATADSAYRMKNCI